MIPGNREARNCNAAMNSPKASGRRATAKSGPRRRLLLVLALCSVVPSCLAQSWSWTCRLDSVPVEDVPLTALQNFQKIDDGRRRLRSSSTGGGDAAALPRDEEVAEGASGEAATHVKGRLCSCADWIHDDESYYCPLPADRCLVSRARYGAPSRGVKCYVHGGWEMGFTRDVWLYLCFIMLLVVLYPCFSSPGRHAVRYVLSWCFPRMNEWIVEHLLRAEIEGRNLVSEEFERFAQRKRRTEGWISGYGVKTKLYSREGTKAEDDGTTNITVDDKDDNLGGEDCENTEGSGTEGENANDREDEDGRCTICLTAVEDGDRVPDLGCVHLFHADCLSEWILKKNSCPLCSCPVAREIRSFETDSPAENTDNASSEAMMSRLRRSARDGILDIATGRDRRAHAANLGRIRAMLDDGSNASTDLSDWPR